MDKNKKTAFIIVRVEESFKVALAKKAGGMGKLSEFVRQILRKIM